MTDDLGNLVQPEGSAVFETTNGVKVRLDYEKIFSYSGTKSKTTIEYGWSYEKESRETFILDIDFDSFDDKLTQYKKDTKKYWDAKYASDSSF